MKPEWRRILELRSVKDKIAVARDCEIAPVGDLPVIAELVREDVLVFAECATLPYAIVRVDGKLMRVGVSTDIYQITPKGIALCEAEGIPQR